jgi:hypothetical protein
VTSQYSGSSVDEDGKPAVQQTHSGAWWQRTLPDAIDEASNAIYELLDTTRLQARRIRFGASGNVFIVETPLEPQAALTQSLLWKWLSSADTSIDKWLTNSSTNQIRQGKDVYWVGGESTASTAYGDLESKLRSIFVSHSFGREALIQGRQVQDHKKKALALLSSWLEDTSSSPADENKSLADVIQALNQDRRGKRSLFE